MFDPEEKRSRKKVKGFLLTKRKIQRRCAAQVEKIAQSLGIPFAHDETEARRILAQRRLGFSQHLNGSTPPRSSSAPFASARVWRPANQQELRAA